jgi:hypothetical protein
MYLSSSACSLHAPRASSSAKSHTSSVASLSKRPDFDYFVERLPADIALKKQAKCEFASTTSFAHNAHTSF